MSEFEPPPQNGTITMTHNGAMHHFFPLRNHTMDKSRCLTLTHVVTNSLRLERSRLHQHHLPLRSYPALEDRACDLDIKEKCANSWRAGTI